jgi:hypothetical protein
VRAALAPAVVALSVYCCSAAAGNYMPPPGDFAAQWLSSSEVAVVGVDRNYRSSVRVVDVDAEVPQERFVARGRNLLVSPDKQLFAYTVDAVGGSSLVVSAADGSGEHHVFDGAAQPAGWLADSSKLILTAPDTAHASERLYSVRPDGSDLVEYPAGVLGVPSPDGNLFAYQDYAAAPPRIRVVTADGTSTITLETRSAGGDSGPSGHRMAPDWRSGAAPGRRAATSPSHASGQAFASSTSPAPGRTAASSGRPTDARSTPRPRTACFGLTRRPGSSG